MSKTLTLSNGKVRQTALDWVKIAPPGSTVTFERPKRTPPQNRLMWHVMGQLAAKARYHGYKLDKEEWKLVMLSGLRSELRLVPSLNNDGVVSLDRSSSRLSVQEMGDLITLAEAWASEHKITITRSMEGFEND